MIYRCLRCKRTWEARVKRPTQCPWCGSRHIISEEKFQRMVHRTEQLIMHGLPARYPRIDALRAVIREEGLIQLLKADETLNLMEEILRELEKKHGPDWYLRYIIFGGFRR